uniref:Ig-like domain-containing protein n=1 Tax=Strongyloides stercoralis TaxID=6248 RepID=A0A0K0ENH7_STRER
MIFIYKNHLFITVLLFIYFTNILYAVDKDYADKFGQISIKVSGLKSGKNIKTFTASKVKVNETIYFGKNLGLKNVHIIKINMNDFNYDEGVRVTLNKGDSSIKFGTFYSQDSDNGIKSLETEKFSMNCNLYICEGGIILLSTRRFDKEDDANVDDVIHALYISYNSNPNYIAKKLKTDEKMPNAYECPKNSWVHPKSGIIFAYHPSSGPIGEETVQHNSRQNPEYIKAFNRVFISPLVSDNNNNIKSCSQITMIDKSVLIWSYELQKDTYNRKRIFIDLQSSSLPSLSCDGEVKPTNNDQYLFISYIPNDGVSSGKRKFHYQTASPTDLYYKSKFLVYQISKDDERRYQDFELGPNKEFELRCYYDIHNVPDIVKVKITLETNAKLGSEFKLSENNVAKTIIVEKDSFSKSKEKIIDIKCKSETKVSDISRASLYKNYYNQIILPKFVKVEGPQNLDKIVKSESDDTIITIKENDFEHYGLYKCIHKNEKDSINFDQTDYFTIIPEDGMNIKFPSKVLKDGKINSNCLIEYPNFAKLKEISMEHEGAKTSTNINDVKSNEHFDFSSDKTKVEFKTTLHKDDIMNCYYETIYNSTFSTTTHFNSDEDFKKSEMKNGVVHSDKMTFIIVAAVAVGLIIICTIVIFVIIRIKRNRRLKSQENSLSGNCSKTKKSKLSKSSMSRSGSKTSKSKLSSSKSKSKYSTSKSSTKSKNSTSRSGSSQIKPTVTLSAK